MRTRNLSAGDAKAIITAASPEKVIQKHLEEVLTQFGWRFHHETDSRKSKAGWPDIVAVRIKNRWSENGSPHYPFVLFLELKTEKGTLRPEQAELWAEFEDIQKTHCETYFAVVRPSNLHEVEKWIQYGWGLPDPPPHVLPKPKATRPQKEDRPR